MQKLLYYIQQAEKSEDFASETAEALKLQKLRQKSTGRGFSSLPPD